MKSSLACRQRRLEIISIESNVFGDGTYAVPTAAVSLAAITLLMVQLGGVSKRRWVLR